jgi:hypothetical protein
MLNKDDEIEFDWDDLETGQDKSGYGDFSKSSGFGFQPDKDDNGLATFALLATQLIYYVGGLLAIIFLGLMFFKGFKWYGDNLYPFNVAVTSISSVLLLIPSIFLSVIRKTRPLGGLGFTLLSGLWLLGLWSWCLMVAVALAGVFWTVVGLLFAGIGVIGVSLIAALISQEWSIALNIIIVLVLVFVSRVVGSALIGSQLPE